MGFNKKAILSLKSKLELKELQPTTEEATKQWLVMPLLVALGYDPYSSDIIPEFTLDVGTKRGEKVDYALQINNRPIVIIECKQLNTQLSEKHISQLYRYFTISDVHIALLTNGDDYWFFTDSKKENIMDLEPYSKIRISEASISELDKLNAYSKELIDFADITQVVRYERFKGECKDLMHSLKTNNAPSWLLEALAERSELIEFDKDTVSKYLYEAVKLEFNGSGRVKKDKGKEREEAGIASGTGGESGTGNKDKMLDRLDKISLIQLNHEYVYNDYSDGDWTYHSIDYGIILGKRFENLSGGGY